MRKLKRTLAMAMALAMAGSMLAACGKDDESSSSGNNSSGGNNSQAGTNDSSTPAGEPGPLVQTKAPIQEQTTAGSEDSKNKIVIYTWNDEFKSRLRDFYPEYDAEASGYKGDGVVGEKEYLKNGKEIVWVTTPSDNGAYQDKLDLDLAAQASSDTKIDMFLVEADYALKYVNGPYTMSVAEVGLTDADIANQYKYTQEVVTDANGVLQGTTWQATPGLFAYRRDIAKEVLGTDDPTEVQALLSDWTKFNEVATKMKEAGYFMLSGYDDSYRTFSNNVEKTWVNSNYEIIIDEQLMDWVDQTKTYTENGYNNGTSLWADQWKADQGSSGKVFGFFYSTWGINFTLLENAEDNKGEKDGLYGQYAVCEGPQAYFWGGTWLIASAGCDNKEEVADIMKALTCNEDIMVEITNVTQDYTNNVTGMNGLAENFSSEFLGGQNHIALFSKSAPEIDCSKLGPYDQVLNELFQAKMKDYFLGEVTLDEALDNFYVAATERYKELKRPA